MLCATRRWKVLDEGYNFGLDLVPIEGLHKKLREFQPWQFRDFQIAIWMRALQRGAEYTIWGKVMASLESGPW
jgi:hypothetical protein